MTRATGIDISHHNGKFTNLGNFDFIFARTSNGTDEDREIRNNLPEIEKTKRRGIYHYYRTNHVEHPMEEQADLFLSFASGMKMIATDYEVSAYDDNVLDKTTAIELYGFLLFLIQEEPDKKHLLYTSIYTWRDVLLPLQGVDSKYGIIDWNIVEVWLPRYGHKTDEYILEINGVPVLSHYDIWQWEADGNGKGEEYGVESDDIDLNVFNGTVEELDQWLGIKEENTMCDECTSLKQKIDELEARINLRFRANDQYIGTLNDKLVDIGNKAHTHPQWMSRWFRKNE